MRVYISGPISFGGTASSIEVAENVSKFYEAELYVKRMGHEPVSPVSEHGADVTGPNRKTWKEYLIADIKTLLDCDAIYLIPGWEKSRGSRLEATIAFELGMELMS